MDWTAFIVFVSIVIIVVTVAALRHKERIAMIKQGKNPVCVLTCPTKALLYDKSDTITGTRRKRQVLKAKHKKS